MQSKIWIKQVGEVLECLEGGGVTRLKGRGTVPMECAKGSLNTTLWYSETSTAYTVGYLNIVCDK